MSLKAVNYPLLQVTFKTCFFFVGEEVAPPSNDSWREGGREKDKDGKHTREGDPSPPRQSLQAITFGAKNG